MNSWRGLYRAFLATKARAASWWPAYSSRGYTIIEVMIVLAVSGVLLVSSITVFNGKRSETEFSQAMFDLQSKFQSYSSQVSSAQLPSGDTYTCGISSSLIGGKAYPVLTYVGGSSSDSASNQVCIYLGKAVQVIPSIGIIYAYPVLGLRTVHNGSTDTGEYPSTPDQANAEPALDSSGNFLQVESYPLLNGIKVVSAKVSGSSAEQDLVMFYSNLQDNNTSGNGITAYSRAYTFAPSDVQSTRLRWCIEGGACGTPAAALGANTWKLCAESSDGSRKGQLEIRSSSTGFITKLDLEGCP